MITWLTGLHNAKGRCDLRLLLTHCQSYHSLRGVLIMLFIASDLL